MQRPFGHFRRNVTFFNAFRKVCHVLGKYEGIAIDARDFSSQFYVGSFLIRGNKSEIAIYKFENRSGVKMNLLEFVSGNFAFAIFLSRILVPLFSLCIHVFISSSVFPFPN